jgi:hypothetical protein
MATVVSVKVLCDGGSIQLLAEGKSSENSYLPGVN